MVTKYGEGVGGYKTREGVGGEEMKFFPSKMGGGLAMLKGGWGKTGFEVVTQELLLDFSHTDGGHKKFPRKVYLCLEGGGGGAANSFGPPIFYYIL